MRAGGHRSGRDLAPERPPQHGRAGARRGSGRSRRWPRRARTGSTCSRTRRRSVDGLGQLAGILPPWVLGRRARRRRSRACATPTTRARLRSECDRYWRFIHKGEWHRVRLQASAAASRLGRAHVRRDRGPDAGLDPWDCYFDVLADAGPTPTRACSSSGRLFTDEHLAEMISHPLFCLGVDTLHRHRATAARGRPAPPARLRGPRPLPHPPRAASGARCGSRRRSGR